MNQTPTAEPVFYIHAPDYTELSSGVKALHFLCDRLNRLGYEAYITGQNSNGKLWTPVPTIGLMNAHKEAGRLQIVVYPEVVMGNPLLIPNVVRYLLNTPNSFFPVWFGRVYEDEKIVHYAQEFAIPWVESDSLRINTVNRDIFHLPKNNEIERSGFLVYSHRVKNLPLERIPDWCQPCHVISMDHPRTPRELAELYRRSRGLILFERTAASLEALMCGCPVIYVDGEGLQEIPLAHADFYNFGVAWGFDKKDYQRAEQTVAFVTKAYDAEDRSDERKIAETIGKVIQYFRNKRFENVQSGPAMAMAYAREDMKQGRFNEAILKYDQVIAQYPDHVEAYYRMAVGLANISWPEVALDILLKGEGYLISLPEHAMLNKIRSRYFSKMAELFQITGKFDQADTYRNLSRVALKLEPAMLN